MNRNSTNKFVSLVALARGVNWEPHWKGKLSSFSPTPIPGSETQIPYTETRSNQASLSSGFCNNSSKLRRCSLSSRHRTNHTIICGMHGKPLCYSCTPYFPFPCVQTRWQEQEQSRHEKQPGLGSLFVPVSWRFFFCIQGYQVCQPGEIISIPTGRKIREQWEPQQHQINQTEIITLQRLWKFIIGSPKCWSNTVC